MSKDKNKIKEKEDLSKRHTIVMSEMEIQRDEGVYTSSSHRKVEIQRDKEAYTPSSRWISIFNVTRGYTFSPRRNNENKRNFGHTLYARPLIVVLSMVL